MDETLLIIEEISHYEALLRIQRRNQRVLELQAARHGPFAAPLAIQSAQDEVRAEVLRIERTLLALRAQFDLARGVVVVEHPAIDGLISFFPASDLAATGRFYGQTLGLTLALDDPACRVYHVVGAAYIGFCQAAWAPDAPKGPILTIITGDMAGWRSRLATYGVVMGESRAAGGGFACDPDGYILEFRQRLNDSSVE